MKSIQEAVASVQNAFPSIYTKEDVIKLLESIEITSAPAFSQETIENLVGWMQRAIAWKLRRLDCSDVVDHSSAEFSIGCRNTIELDSVDIDTDKISDELEGTIEDAINGFFEEGGFVNEVEEETEQAS